jgi:3-oxoacyl-[acyl-carrier protein] reductase
MELASPRVVVVTGSSSGIGSEIAKALVQPGDLVVLHARRNVSGLMSQAQSLQERGVETRCLLLDLEREEHVHKGVEFAFSHRGRVDVWCNAAGADVLTGDQAKESFERKLRRLWLTDVQATITLSRAVAIRMSRQSTLRTNSGDVILPSIINVGWDQALQGMEGDSGQYFSVTKGAIMTFTKSIAQSVSGVRVNCLAPGWIKTAWGEMAPSEWDMRARSESCLDRWGTPSEVAEVASFLASPKASFVNGQIIAVNGGWRSKRTDTVQDSCRTNSDL